MSDNVPHQAKEIAQAVQKAIEDSSPSEQQNITINLNYSPVYNYNNCSTINYGDNISLYSSSSSSNIINSVNIAEQHNHYNQPLRIQTEPFLKTTVYDSDKVTNKTVLHLSPSPYY